ncbi:MAG: hypothetical protein CL464_10905 [Acidimicrobiaceae bacterium]|nr:hypothetical protein [Acidimicrobiaceae bacterium]|tara:strand:+ start:1327 stop:2664 length:1338 start_codon:yes stop_codon:yes gene_type:complete
MNDMTYIMSGASMALKPGMGDKQDGDIYSGMVTDTIKEFDSGVNYEIMFNAYNEVNAMVNYFSKYNYFGTKWHADSGGLQMITLGKEITEELKEKVYRVQAQYSSYAMCFDELPIHVLELKGKQSRIDLSGRRYIEEWAKQRALNTGNNVKRQIEVFREMKSDSKVFLICQGNNVTDFVEYYNNAMSVIPKEYYSSMAGIALSAACTGLGRLEAIQMLGSYGFMDIPKEIGNKLHVLGFGSIKRLWPLLLLKESGYINKDITFDSSSHAIKPILGEFEGDDGRTYKFGTEPHGEETLLQQGNTHEKDIIEGNEFLYEKYGHILKQYYDMDFEEFFEIVGCFDVSTSARYNLDCKRQVTTNLYHRWLMAFQSCYKFGKDIIQTRKDMREGIFDSGIPAMNDLINVKTKEDFIKWFKVHSKHMVSNPIIRCKTLEDVEKKTIVALPI